MGVINRVARGFLDLVDSQTQGKTPPAFIDAVAPTLDMSEFYLAETLGSFEIEATHTIPGSFEMEVALNEIWRVRGLAVVMPSAATNAAEQWSVGMTNTPRVADESLVPAPSPRIWMTGVDLMSTTTASRTIVRAVQFASPLIVLPGTSLVWSLLQRDAAGIRLTQLQAVIDILRT